ncbi:SAM-dependent methyltransferase [Solihabitans fulvus]|uniref:SAM-dependent methyltransferase n=1 Tax=Solihabitans fulvus TaxID=1892852 RepID=UPI001661ECE0|nr:SAM-dependent methyltransferase [Solihabitans fulvus]
MDLERASPSRVYDYLIGGGCNFAVDRQWAEQAIKRMPWIRAAARSNRAFLRRAVRMCAEEGVRQFLDLGSGIPTILSVHEMAWQVDRDCRVVYVDNERVAVAHSELTLAGIEGADIIEADMCDVDRVLGDPVCQRLLDLDRPIALLATASLYYIPDAELAARTVDRYLDAVPSGSYLVLSHATLGQDRRDAMKLSRVLEMTHSLTSAATARTPEWIAGLLAGLELVQPGLVYTSFWRPESLRAQDDTPWHDAMLAAVGRKP